MPPAFKTCCVRHLLRALLAAAPCVAHRGETTPALQAHHCSAPRVVTPPPPPPPPPPDDDPRAELLCVQHRSQPVRAGGSVLQPSASPPCTQQPLWRWRAAPRQRAAARPGGLLLETRGSAAGSCLRRASRPPCATAEPLSRVQSLMHSGAPAGGGRRCCGRLNNATHTHVHMAHTSAASPMHPPPHTHTRTGPQERLLAEVDAFGRGRGVAHADLDAFPYAEAVVKESLRLSERRHGRCRSLLCSCRARRPPKACRCAAARCTRKSSGWLVAHAQLLSPIHL